MKKRTLLAAALSGAFSVGAFAHGMYNQQGMMNGQCQQNTQRAQGMGMMGNGMAEDHCTNSGANHMGRGMRGFRGMGMMRGGMRMFSQLNLTSEQRYQLSILRDEMKLKMKKQMHNAQPMGQMGAFFKGDNFDKDAFKKQMDKRREKMLDLMADNMDKAFKILTKEQKDQLKENMK